MYEHKKKERKLGGGEGAGKRVKRQKRLCGGCRKTMGGGRT